MANAWGENKWGENFWGLQSGDIDVNVTSPGDLPWGTESWGYGSWGNIGGMDISIGQDTILVPSVEVEVTGNQLNTSTGDL